MDNVFFARSQMAVSLAFHIIFASIGITMPLLMVIAEGHWLWKKDRASLDLAHSWAKGTAVFFAIGAVSGTVLAFELGLLFPKFMEEAGGLIGLPFALEGFAFFTEAIFLGIYLYGWDRVSPLVHLFCGVIIAVSGVASTVFVTIANAWMNFPTGFERRAGSFVNTDPLKALLSPFVWNEVPHNLVAAFMGTAFAVAGIHAFVLLKKRSTLFHQMALKIALSVALPLAILQPFIGHFSGEQVARLQPLKLAAIEGQFQTTTEAPLHLGGIVDYTEEKVRYAIKIPYLLSVLATGNPHGTVHGLKDFPKEDWPSPIVHYCFDAMVVLGTYLLLLALAGLFAWKKTAHSKRFLRAILFAAPMGYLATEAGWFVTEVGRQPWVIYGILRTKDAVTPMPGLFFPLATFSLVYAVLGCVSLAILRKQVVSSSGAST